MKLVFALFVFSSLAFADDKNHITVQGQCDLKVVPDRGSITFTAENTAKNQQDAVKKTNDQINQLKSEIKKMNLAGLQLKNTNYSVYPVREYEKEKMVDKGTRVSLSLEVETSDITKLGESMVLASQLNIQNVSSLQTFLSLEKSQKEYLKCLDIAADDAKAKATQLARKLNLKLGDVIRVQEGVRSNPAPVYHDRAMMKSAMAPTNIEAGTQQFSTSIEVSFAIK